MASVCYPEVTHSSTWSGLEISQACPIDLTEVQDKVNAWVIQLNFKPREAGRHFKKHKTDNLLRHIQSVDEYVKAARENIVNSLFDRGFAIRSSEGDKIAFFTCDERNYPDKLTIIQTIKKVGKLITFYPANGKTPALVIRSFSDYPVYIAYFCKGRSEKGWQEVSYDRNFQLIVASRAPDRGLENSVNFIFESTIG